MLFLQGKHIKEGTKAGILGAFEERITDIPMTAMCTAIERDLKEMLGETDLAAKKMPIDGF